MASSAESPFLHHAAELGVRIAADEKADAVRIVLEHLLAAAADEQEGFPARRLGADHIKGLFRHVDLERIGKRPMRREAKKLTGFSSIRRISSSL